MQIHQLSVTYIQEQDRILARINTTSGEELRLWFTRRLTLGLMPLLSRMIAEQVARDEARKAPVVAADDSARQMLAEFKKEETLQKADFKTPFKDQPAALPLGAEPLLVTEINISPLANGQLQMAFAEKIAQTPSPRGFQMALEQQLVLGFAHLMETAVKTSQWMETPAAPAAVSPPADGEPSKGGAGGQGGGGERPRYLN